MKENQDIRKKEIIGYTSDWAWIRDLVGDTGSEPNMYIHSSRKRLEAWLASFGGEPVGFKVKITLLEHVDLKRERRHARKT